MAETIKGINVVIGSDTTGLSNALSDVNKKSRDIQSELKQVEKLLKLDPTNTDLLAQKQKLLADAVANTRDKLDRLKAAQDQVDQQFKNGDITEGQYRAFQREVAKTEQELNNLDGKLNETNQVIKSQGVEVSKLGKDYKDSFDEAQRSMGNSFEQMKKVGTGMTIAGGAIAAGLGVAVKGAADFEQSMANVYSVMAPDEVKEFSGELKDLAVTMGADTKYSATEAAKGIEELVKAGVSVKDIMGGGLQGALSLATAGELELGDAAEIASTALNAFKKDALTVSQAADILAGAANASATDVSELKFGLSASASVASSVGLTFKDTATALAVFAQNGLKGSDAGTSLKTMLMNLQPSTEKAYNQFKDLGLLTLDVAKSTEFLAKKGIKPVNDSVDGIIGSLAQYLAKMDGAKSVTGKYFDEAKKMAEANGWLYSSFYNANGSLKSMAEISDLLTKSMSGLNDMQRQAALETMFGSDAIRAGSILYKEGAKGIDEMATAMGKIKADDVAAAKMNTLNGTIEQLSGSIETAKISIGQALLPALRKLATVVQGGVDAFNNLSPGMKSFIAIGGAVTAALMLIVGPLLMLIGFIPQIVAGFTMVGTALKALTAIQWLYNAALDANPIGLVIIALAALAAAAIVVIKNWEPISQFFVDLWGSIASVFKGAWEAISSGMTSAWEAISSTTTTVFQSISSFFTEVWTGIISFLTDTWAAISNAAKIAFDGLVNIIKPILEGLKLFFTGIWEVIKNIFGGALLLIINLVTGNFTELSKNAQAIWNNLKDAFGKIWEGIKQVFSGAVNLLKTILSGAWEAITSTASAAWSGFKTIVSDLVTGTVEVVKNIWNGTITWFKELPGKLYNIGSDMFTKMKEAVTSTVTTVKDAIVTGMTAAIDWLKQLPNQMLQLGKDMIMGLVNGIKNMIGSVGNAISDLANSITDGIKSALDIHSPSRVMKKLGEYTGQGFAIGIGNTVSSVRQKANDMAAAASSALNGTMVPSVGGIGSGSGSGGDTYNLDGMFAGANFHVRNDNDIKLIAKELWGMTQQSSRGMGGARG
ncbi:Phage-related minor tail protein [compost metagenome]